METIIVCISGNDMAISGVAKTWLSLSAASAARRRSGNDMAVARHWLVYAETATVVCRYTSMQAYRHLGSTPRKRWPHNIIYNDLKAVIAAFLTATARGQALYVVHLLFVSFVYTMLQNAINSANKTTCPFRTVHQHVPTCVGKSEQYTICITFFTNNYILHI